MWRQSCWPGSTGDARPPDTRAQADLTEAADWYAANRTRALARDLVSRVRAAIARLAAHPLIGTVVLQDVRRVVVTGTPYIVVYVPDPAEVVVIAVFHSSRDPGIWQARV